MRARQHNNNNSGPWKFSCRLKLACPDFEHARGGYGFNEAKSLKEFSAVVQKALTGIRYYNTLMGIEKRKHPRRELGLKAVVTWPRPVPCTISDVSATGARLTTEFMDLLPDRFDLALNADIMRKCQVVWRRKNQVGVKFLPHVGRGRAAEPRQDRHERVEIE